MPNVQHEELSHTSNAMSAFWDRQSIAAVAIIATLLLGSVTNAAQGHFWFAAAGSTFALITILLFHHLFSGFRLLRVTGRAFTVVAGIVSLLLLNVAMQWSFTEFTSTFPFVRSVWRLETFVRSWFILVVTLALVVGNFVIFLLLARDFYDQNELRGVCRFDDANISEISDHQTLIDVSRAIKLDASIGSGLALQRRELGYSLIRALGLGARTILFAALTLAPPLVLFFYDIHTDSPFIFKLESGALYYDMSWVFTSPWSFLTALMIYVFYTAFCVACVPPNLRRHDAAELDLYLKRQSYNLAKIQDLRPPILFLRSFRDDRILIAPKNPFKRLSGYNIRFEEAISSMLLGLGVPVAIDPVGRTTKLRGAYRLFQSDDSWQLAFRNLLGQAKWIALTPGKTPGLAWEISEIISSNALNRLVIVLPPEPARSDRAAKWFALLDMFKESNYHALLKGIDIEGLLTVCFPRGNGLIVCIKGQTGNQMDYELALTRSLTVLRSAG